MKLYHGSRYIITNPVFGGGRKYNDYGQGFYCTESVEMAKEWAVSENRSGFANCYDLNESGLSILDLNSEDYTTLHWLTILLQNRTFEMESVLASEAKEYLQEHFAIDISPFDLIRGYRADDSYFSFAQDFLNGTISYRQLTNAMHLGKLGEQIVLKSRRAFDRIASTGHEVSDCDEYYVRRMNRDKAARGEYFNAERNRRRKDDLFILHLLDEEVKPDDPRLR